MKRTPEFTAAQPLAEHIPVDIAQQNIRHFESRHKPAGLFHSAWSHVEYALCRSNDMDDDLRKSYLDYSQEMLGTIIKASVSEEVNEQKLSRRVPQDLTLGALTLSNYIPAFRKRASGEPLSQEDCAELYVSLGAEMRYLHPLEVDEPPQWRMAEIAMLALSARTTQPEFLLYPASPREESSTDQTLNHDSYFVNHDTKIPLQQKLIRTDKTYDDCVTILTLEPLLDKSVARAKIDDTAKNRSEKLNRLLSLIVAETSDENLDRHEKQFLDTVTRAIVAHRYAGERALVA